MVKIVDGEIIREDDPRYKTVLNPEGSLPSGAGAQQSWEDSVLYGPQASRPTGAVFDFSRSPLAIAWEPAGESFFGLPGLDVFGAHMRSVHLLFLTAATLFLGWRGFIMGAAIWVAYKLTSDPDIPDPRAVPHGGNLPQSFLERYMQPGGGREYQPGSLFGQQGANRGRSAQQPAGQPGTWDGRGRGQRLGTA